MTTLNVDNESLVPEFGSRLAQLRIEAGLTQAALAARAGIGKRTVERLESEGNATLDTMFRILRVLGLSERFEALFPRTPPSPVALLALRGKVRRRASKPRKGGNPPTQWTWGPEG